MNQGFEKTICPKCKGTGQIYKVVVKNGEIHKTDQLVACVKCGGAGEINNLEDRMLKPFIINCICGHKFEKEIYVETIVNGTPILDKEEEVQCPKCNRLILAYVNGKLDYRFKLKE